jgi:hypothetical protein
MNTPFNIGGYGFSWPGEIHEPCNGVVGMQVLTATFRIVFRIFVI